ncbi:unnamed protein product (macronuclear) [Paramecium tetraurelia]|uniref:Major facilitator superfamily (MFS) profile domain-containing protein n=1 Tax=Paramecium tetraurelia TaxID=5888 RepID=A0BM17_PARTE|nr:uncharacterized protein GSPATT00030218001 [Paramecium tetraurelia]CAK59584.1 unnamed protein product [Paramecium tetraurelia]|eukprot:XP_001426982.1 hypothetical protein (macronuclear) [Paramecium tetraurelia strain d4-2]
MSEQILEQVLEQRLGFGKHYWRQFFIISFIDFLDGAEFLYLALLIPAIKQEWNLSIMELSIFGSSFTLGLTIGSIICGFLADRMGRKTILIIGTVFQVFYLFVFLTVFTNNIIEMILLRLIYGTVIGMNLPISSILMIEVTPKLHRGKIIVALQVLILLGRGWIMILGYIFMESISKGNWRAISLCNSVPCLLCIIGTIFWIQESPRFLILNEEIQKGIDNLNQIGQFNNSEYQMLTEDEIQSLKEWAQLQKQHHQQKENNSIKQLFNQDNLAITWMNYSINFLFMFAMMAIFNILPFILDDENKTLLHLYILDIGEIPAIFVMLYSIDKFGRLSTLLFSTSVLTLILFSTWHWKLYIIITGLAIFKFCCKINCGTLNVLFAESYHTLYRSLGLGTTNAMGGIAGSLAPFVVFPIYFYNYYLPFLICGVFSLFTLILLIFYPIDLTKKPLDQLKQK